MNEDMMEPQPKPPPGVEGALQVEHEIQRLMLERLGIKWPPGEPFYSVIEEEIAGLRAAIAILRTVQDDPGSYGATNRELTKEVERLRAEVDARALRAYEDGKSDGATEASAEIDTLKELLAAASDYIAHDDRLPLWRDIKAAIGDLLLPE